MKFTTHCVANILQNISNGKRITGLHVRYAMASAYLAIYQGKTMYSTNMSYQQNKYGHFPHADLLYIKKVNGVVKVLWKLTFHTAWALGPVNNATCEQRSNPSYVTGISLNNIQIDEGESKMILHCYFYFERATNRYLLNGYNTTSITARQAFGFWVLTPKGSVRDSRDIGGGFFMDIVVFTPKLGLFDEKVPSELVSGLI
jgi:hypothetical protein